MLIAFSGPIGAGTSDLSQVVADLLGWPRVKFSDHIRAVAIEQSSDPEDLNVLQAIGQSLVVDHLEEFVTAVLARADWRKDGNLIVDGLRHIEVKTEMLRQIGPVALHVVHVERALDERAQSRGMNEAELEAYDAELSEAQLERILPQYANCILDGSKDHRELAERVIELFTGRSQSSIAADAGELINLMMPLMIDQGSPRRKRPADLAVELLRRSKDLGARVPKGLAEPLADVVRAMNSYYSNSIEGHVTLPIDIERALNHDYSEEDHDRHNRQVEARAHIEVQRWLDEGNVPLDRVTQQLVLRQIHSQFFSHLPEDFHWVRDRDEEWRVTPGEYRQRYVEIGRHQSVSPGAVPRFMDAFERGYRNLELTDRILAAAAAHHRFLWIHPFLDGNGRVARLMSDVMLRSALDASGLWSVTRGLARKQDKYKGLLGQCDLPPRNSLDGRGNLSEEALTEFTIFFLETALDQVDYMEHLVQPDRFEFRLTQLVKEEIAIAKLNPLAENMVLHLSLYGPTAAERVSDIVGADEPAAERALDHFVKIGLVSRAADSLKLELPMRLLPRLLPGLFPED
jgi:Fic family protein/adenylate kinase family enzyme